MTKAEAKKFEGFREQVNTEEEAWILWMRWKCLSDLYYLFSEVIGLSRVKDKRGRHRLDPKLHRKMAGEMEREEDTLQLYPRIHMKSSMLKALAMQKILQNQNVRIGLWSKTATLCYKELESIKRQFENPLLRELFPEIVVPRKQWEKDTKEEFTMKRDNSEGEIPQENQIEAWGVGATVTGHHYDYHFYDDVIDQSSVTTAVQIEKVEDWWEYMQAIKDVTAIEKAVGTRYHMHDIYGRIMAEGYFEEKNIVVEKCMRGNKPIYSFFTYKDLMKLRKRMGPQKFEAQMNNNPVPKEDKIFVPPYPLYRPEWFPKKPKYYLTVDPAATARKYSNESGVVISAVDSEAPNKIFYVEAEGVKMLPNELADHIVSKIHKYRPKKVGIELGLQQALQPLIDIKLRELEKRCGEWIHPVFDPIPTGKQNKAEKLNRTIGALIHDRRALFKGAYNAKGELVADKGMVRLFRQMDFYNPASDKNEDDIVDAASMAPQTIEHFAPSHWFKGGAQEYNPGYSVEELINLGKKKNEKRWGWQYAS